MTAGEQMELRRMAEGFRTRAGQVEGKYGKHVWVQAINVMEAFDQCAEELEAFVAVQDPVPAAGPSSECQVSEIKQPEQTANAS